MVPSRFFFHSFAQFIFIQFLCEQLQEIIHTFFLFRYTLDRGSKMCKDKNHKLRIE